METTFSDEDWIYLSLVGFSCLIGLLTFGIALKIQAYSLFINELMMYIVFSECLYALSRFLCLKRNDIMSYIQLCFSIFCDTFTLLSSLIISIKIWDSLMNKSMMFSRPVIILITRCFIIIATLITTLLVLLFQTITYIECSSISCHFDKTINEPLMYFFTGLTLIQVLCCCITISYVFYCLRDLRNRNETDSTQLRSKLKSILYQLTFFPVITFLLWTLRLFPQLINVKDQKGQSTPLYLIPTSIRCLIYSISLIINQTTLKDTIFYCWLCKRKRVKMSSFDRTDLSIIDNNV